MKILERGQVNMESVLNKLCLLRHLVHVNKPEPDALGFLPSFSASIVIKLKLSWIVSIFSFSQSINRNINFL